MPCGRKPFFRTSPIRLCGKNNIICIGTFSFSLIPLSASHFSYHTHTLFHSLFVHSLFGFYQNKIICIWKTSNLSSLSLNLSVSIHTCISLFPLPSYKSQGESDVCAKKAPKLLGGGRFLAMLWKQSSTNKMPPAIPLFFLSFSVLSHNLSPSSIILGFLSEFTFAFEGKKSHYSSLPLKHCRFKACAPHPCPRPSIKVQVH